MNQTWNLGTMQARFEEPNTFFSASEGEADAESMRSLNRIAEELASKHGKLFALVDMRRSTGMTSDARKAATDYTNGSPFAAIAFIGGSFAMRTMVNMMIRAAQLLKREEAPMRFFENEAEARAWLDEQRKQSNPAAS